MPASTLLLGTRKGLLVLERGARGAFTVTRRAHAGIPVPYARVDPRSGTLWTCLEHGHWGGKLARSRDGGRAFEDVAPPKYPETAFVKEGVKAALGYLWVLEPGGRDEPGVLYAGTVPGGLFRSADDGATWSLVDGLWQHPTRQEGWFSGGLDRDHAGIHSIIVDPRASARVHVGISCGGSFTTEDGGVSWRARNKGVRCDFLPKPDAEAGHDPHCVAACASAPDVLWQQNHCGIFRSEDGGRSWVDISEATGPACFGFAIAADARDPARAWVVPGASDEERNAVGGALCVCRSEDGGKSWHALRKGLPQEHAYDLVLRHALDASEDTVAFGSTTGNVFISEDRGESWTSLGHHFPPVYSVRFA